MDTLPDNVLVQIFSHSSPTDMARLMRCCQRFRDLIGDDYVWQCAFRQRWGQCCAGQKKLPSWREAYCVRIKEVHFWKDCKVSARTRDLRRMAQGTFLDARLDSSGAWIEVVGSGGVSYCPLNKAVEELRPVRYFDTQLMPSVGHFIFEPLQLALGTVDGDLYLFPALTSGKDDSAFTLSSATRFNSRIFNKPVLDVIGLEATDSMLVRYASEAFGTEFAIWRREGRKLAFHLALPQTASAWDYLSTGQRVMLVISRDCTVELYSMNTSNESEELPSIHTPGHTFTFSQAVKQLRFVGSESVLISTKDTCQLMGINTLSKKDFQLKIKNIWTGHASDTCLLQLTDNQVCLLHAEGTLISLPLPGHFTCIRDALIDEYFVLAVFGEGFVLFDPLTGEQFASHRLPIRFRDTYSTVKVIQFSPRRFCFVWDAQFMQVFHFHASSHSLAHPALSSKQAATCKKSASAKATRERLRASIADWRDEEGEESRLDCLRGKFNLDSLSEGEMLQLAMLMSKDSTEANEANTSKEVNDHDIDSDLALALMLSLEDE